MFPDEVRQSPTHELDPRPTMNPDRDAAIAAVRDRMASLRTDPRDLARAAPADPDTVGDFLEGRRWPRLTTLAKMDVALGWEPGTIDRLSRGQAPAYVSPVEDAFAGVLLDVTEDAYADLYSPESRADADVLRITGGNSVAGHETQYVGTRGNVSTPGVGTRPYEDVDAGQDARHARNDSGVFPYKSATVQT
jgi:hypothetical protein